MIAYMLVDGAYIDYFMNVCTLLTKFCPQITRGMKAARQADTCTLKGAILGLARDQAARLDCILDVGLRKDQRGINNKGTACLFLPPKHVGDYLADPEE